jgi:pimeloyl-ACP methyl ester carboxylesterase
MSQAERLRRFAQANLGALRDVRGWLTTTVARICLDELGSARARRDNIVTPHVAGNSLGGWVALELAGIRPVASLALLSPAGMWRGTAPLYNRVSLRGTRWFAKHATGPLCRLMRYRLARMLVPGQISANPPASPRTMRAWRSGRWAPARGSTPP